jgi:uncharacterized protein (DUF302 family)
MPSAENNGIVRIPSRHSVDEIVAKLKQILQAKGVVLFAVIDHSGEAAKAGLQMPNTKLLVFGNPKAGTPVMLAAPSIAIDLPMKILVAENGAGKTWVSYNSADYLGERHGVPGELRKALAAVEGLAAAAAE